jgi:DNA (cytosine-5)-methyltransferase 1
MDMKKTLKFIDLFSGCGGFSCGLELAGHKCILGVDSDKYASQTFAKNHPHAKVFNQSIEELSVEVLTQLLGQEKVEMIVGGPPCQGFSTVGRGKVDDVRNNLFTHFVKVVSWLKPKIVILENVTGLLAKKNSPVLKKIFKQFESLGYSMSAKILSAEYYGAPTHRRRTFIVGTLSWDPNEIFPVPSKKLLTIQDAWDKGLKTKNGKIYNHELDKAEILNSLEFSRVKKIPEGCGIRYKSDEDKYFSAKLKLGIDWDNLPEKRLRQKKFHRLHRHKISPTVMTSSRTYYHPTEARYLTIREAAAIQSFPPNFVFMGSYTSMYRQIGNAVPPQVAKAFGEKIAQLTQMKKKKKEKKSFNIHHLRSKAFRYQEELH